MLQLSWWKSFCGYSFYISHDGNRSVDTVFYISHDGNRSVDTVFIALTMEIVLWIQFLYISRWKSFCGYSFLYLSRWKSFCGYSFDSSHDGNRSVDTVFYISHDGNRSVDTVFIALTMEIVLWIQFLYLSRWKSFCGYSFLYLSRWKSFCGYSFDSSHDGNRSVDTVFTNTNTYDDNLENYSDCWMMSMAQCIVGPLV